MKTLMVAVAAIGLLAQAGLAAQGEMSSMPSMAGSQQDTAMGGDARVAGLIQAANEAEIAAGKAAWKKAKTKAVRDFAKMMVTEHTKAAGELAATTKRLGIQPAESDDVASLKEGAKRDYQMLQSAGAKEFDQTYIDSQVKAHHMVLEKLDQAVANNQGSPNEFGELVKKTRETVARHLDHAEKLQSQAEGNAQ